jgi:H+/gluconate symporter-like permease
MSPEALSVIGIFLGLATLIVLALRGWSIIIIAPIATIIVLLFSRVELLKGLNELYMKGFSGLAMKFFFLFLLGTIFGKVMEDSGAAKRIAAFILRLTGKTKEPYAVVGLTHKEAYKPIFFMAVLTPLLTNAISIILAALMY